MNEQLKVLTVAAQRLTECGIPYMITGSMALVVYATPRLTRDIDIVIDPTESSLGQLLGLYAGEGYVSEEAAVEALHLRGMFNFIDDETLLKLDFIVHKGDAYTTQQFARRRPLDLGGVVADFISPEDLILAKLLWSRELRSERQEADARTLLSEANPLDIGYIERAAQSLGLADVLQEIRG
jgi:hypothetical protein